MKEILLYPFRRLELLLADIFYNNVKLLFLKDDEEIDEMYWEWIDAVEEWKKGETHYKIVEAKHEILAAYVTGAMHSREKTSMKTKIRKQMSGIRG